MEQAAGNLVADHGDIFCPKQNGPGLQLNLAVSDILAPDGGIGRHNHPKCSTRPKSNRAFWDRKRETNMARDRHVTRQLRRQEWKVIRIWQHALQKSPAICINRLRLAVNKKPEYFLTRSL